MYKKLLVLFVILVSLNVASASVINISSSGTSHVTVYDEPDSVIGVFYYDGDLFFRTININTGDVSNATKLADATKPVSAVFGNDNFYVVGEGPNGIVGVKTDYQGNSQQFTVSTGTDTDPSITYNKDTNEILVAWVRTDLNGTNIFTQLFDANTLTGKGEEDVTSHLNPAAAGSSFNPQLGYDADNTKNYLLVFETSNSPLFAMTLDSNGKSTTSAGRFPDTLSSAAGLDDENPSLVYFNDEFYSVYETTRLGFIKKDIYMSVKTIGGASFDFEVATPPATDELGPKLALYTIVDPLIGRFDLQQYGFTWYDDSGKVKFHIRDDNFDPVIQPLDVDSGSDPNIIFLDRKKSYFVSYINSGIKGKFYDTNGNEINKHTFTAPTDPTTAGMTFLDDHLRPISPGDSFFNDFDVYFLDQNGDYRSRLRLLFSVVDVDLSGLKIISEPTKTLALTGGLLGVDDTHALYIRNTNNGSGVRVCPEAKNISQVGDLCAGERYITGSRIPYAFGGITVDNVILNGKNYYEVNGFKSGGGVELLISDLDLSVNDTSDFTNGTVNKGQRVDVLVDYTENDIDIIGATCQITFNSQPDGLTGTGPFTLTYKKSFHRFNFNYTQDGVYNYTVTCSAAGKKSLSATKSLQVGSGVSGGTVPVCNSDWNCTDWSPDLCQPGEYQTRVCTDKNNCGIGKPTEKRNCPLTVCQENWECSDFGACLYGKQERQCIDKNRCGTEKNKPPEEIPCVFENPQGGFPWIPVIIIVIALVIIGLLALYFYKR